MCGCWNIYVLATLYDVLCPSSIFYTCIQSKSPFYLVTQDRKEDAELFFFFFKSERKSVTANLFRLKRHTWSKYISQPTAYAFTKVGFFQI